MNPVNRWLLPEGVEEILPPEAMRLERLCREIIDLLAGWGYEFVIPPPIEYLESLLTGAGEDLDLQTFKLIDQLSGRLMGVRADITPQVARIDAHRLQRDIPVRLCYLGSVLHARPGKPGDTRAPMQAGAELYGHAGIASDIEIVRLMLATLARAGLEQPCIDLGHIGLFRALSAASALNAAQQREVFDILQRKAGDELRALYKAWGVSDAAGLALAALIDFNGDQAILKEAAQRFAGVSAAAGRAIAELEALAAAIGANADILVNIDLAELRGYHYHTGMVYTAFAPGQGEGIAFGGRYDDIGRAFGRARPATGFSVDVKSLIRFSDPPVAGNTPIFAPAGHEEALLKQINALRAGGEVVIQQLDGQKADARQMGCGRRLVFEDGTWQIRHS